MFQREHWEQDADLRQEITDKLQGRASWSSRVSGHIGSHFFIGFMAAFGNDTPAARFALSIFEIYFIVAFPLWAIPLSYIAGCCLYCPANQEPGTPQ